MKDDTDTYKKEEETSNYRSGWTRPLQVSRYTQPTYLPSSCSESNATSWKRETTEVSNNNNEEQVYEAEFVPRWKKYVLCGTIIFFAILTVSIVGGVLAGSRSSSDTKETPPPGQENMRISSDFCPTMYSDFFRRQLTYHSKEVFSIENDGGYLG